MYLLPIPMKIKCNTLSGRYCGLEIPHPVTSFSNSLVVNFISDHSISKKGFRATYSASTSSKTYPDILLKVLGGHTCVVQMHAFHLPLFQVVEEIWSWKVVHLTVLTIQILIHLTSSVCGPSEAHQGIVSNSHLR